MIQDMSEIIIGLVFYVIMFLGPIAGYRYITGRAAGKLVSAGHIMGAFLIVIGVVIALNEFAIPRGFTIGPRGGRSNYLATFYQPGAYLSIGVVIVVFGWGLRKFGRWAELRLWALLEQQGRNKSKR